MTEYLKERFFFDAVTFIDVYLRESYREKGWKIILLVDVSTIEHAGFRVSLADVVRVARRGC